MKDVKARDAHEVTLMLPVQEEASLSYEYSQEELLRDYSFFVQPAEAESSGMSLRSRVTELESEVVKLRDQLGKAKGVNDMMWETVVQKLVPQGSKEKERAGVELAEESTRRRKRGRI